MMSHDSDEIDRVRMVAMTWSDGDGCDHCCQCSLTRSHQTVMETTEDILTT
jgi:hypothetical protein